MLKAALRFVLKFVIGPIVGTLIGRVVIEVCHLLGLFPERWIAERFLAAPSQEWIDVALWSIAAATGISLSAVTYFFLFVRAGHFSRVRPESRSTVEMEESQLSRRPPPIPLDQSSLSAYIWANPRVKRINKILAQDLETEIDNSETGSLHLEEKARSLGVNTISALDELLENNEDQIIRIAHYLSVRPERS